MKKGQVIEGKVSRVDFPNKGIVETEEGVCVVKNALPGQKVKCSVNKVRKGKAEGRLLEVTEASPLEIECPCPHFGICGGCTYLSLPYEEQLKIKEAQVKKLLDSVLIKQGDYLFEGIKASPVCFGYRNKMEFSFGDEIKDGPLSLGMHKRGSFYDVISVTDCQIVDEDYRKILRCVREYFTALQEQGIDVKFYHRLRHVGYLRHLLVRKAAKTGEILIALITTTQLPEKVAAGQCAEADKELETQILDGLRQKLLQLPLDGKIVGILHTKNDAVADVVQSDETDILYGQDFFYEELLGLKFKISQFSFFQTNSRGAEVLYQTARDYISGYIQSDEKEKEGQTSDKVVFDLYSGTGTIAQLMAPVAKKVIGVEIVEEAVEAARKNAELNGLHNCEFVAGDVLKVLDTIEEKPDIIILDPPRDGIHPKALDKIIRYGVDHILYISCKPTSLARDIEVFLERGYQVERAVAVDQFPWTANIETVVLLSKLKSSKKIEVDLDISELDLTKAEAKATYEEIRQYIIDKYGLKVNNLYIAQVKREYGLIERINYNIGSGKNHVPQVTPEKREAIIDALKYFQMIE
ncbi:MAG: 23S rRNA (uracil(1939)-C(5))-methyltransferase RlmD [Lachnospiraceae bacterium]|nr:23S rRNA (uracil(1939)-C(5))-methyltransferase RlmD [Lachnospiraceae bacterium]